MLVIEFFMYNTPFAYQNSKYDPPSAAFVIDDSDVLTSAAFVNSDDDVIGQPKVTDDIFLARVRADFLRHPDPQNRAVRTNLGRTINPTYQSEERTAVHAVLEEFVDDIEVLEGAAIDGVIPDIDLSSLGIHDATSNLGHTINPTYEAEQRTINSAVLAEFVDEEIETQTLNVLETPKADHSAQKTPHTVVCKIVHKFASVWCKTALEEVGVSLP